MDSSFSDSSSGQSILALKIINNKPQVNQLPPLPHVPVETKSPPTSARIIPDDQATIPAAYIGIPYAVIIGMDSGNYPQLTAFITCPNGTSSDHTLTRTSEGVTISFLPTIVGEYSVMLISAGKVVFNPFSVTVVPPITGKKKDRFRVGDRVYCHRIVSQSGVKQNEIDVLVMDKQGFIVDCDPRATFMGDGYAISFLPAKKGIYYVDVKINGFSVDRPIEVEVQGRKKQQRNKENIDKTKPSVGLLSQPIDCGNEFKKAVPGQHRIQTAREYANARIKSIRRGSNTLFPKSASADLPQLSKEDLQDSGESNSTKTPVSRQNSTFQKPRSKDKKVEIEDEIKEDIAEMKKPHKRSRSNSCKNVSKSLLEPDQKIKVQSPRNNNEASKAVSPKENEKHKIKREKYRSDPSKGSPAHRINARTSIEKHISKRLLKFKSQRNLCDVSETNLKQICVSIIPPENFELAFLTSYTVTVKKGDVTVPSTLTTGHSDTLLVQFFPSQIGRYLIQVYNGSQPLLEEPVKVIVESLVRSCLSRNRAGERCLFSINNVPDKKGIPVNNYTTSELSAIMAGPDIVLGKVISVAENNENNLYIEFVAPKPGLYKGQIYYKGASILNSPIILPVDIELIQQALSPSVNNFCDSSGFKLSIRPVINQNNIQLEYNSSDIIAEIKTDTHETLNGMIQVLSDGRIEVLFPSTPQGIHTAQVFLWGQPIMPSSIEINTVKNEPVQETYFESVGSSSSVEFARDEEYKSMEREERLREQCSKLTFLINNESSNAISESQVDWKNIIQQAQPLFDRLDWTAILTQSEDSIFNYYKNITDSILYTVNSITKVRHLFDPLNQEKITSELQDIEKLFYNFFQLIIKTLKMDRPNRIEYLEEFIDYSKNIKSHFIVIFSLFKKSDNLINPLSPRSNPTIVSRVPDVKTQLTSRSDTSSNSPKKGDFLKKSSVAARRTGTVAKNHTRVASDLKDLTAVREARKFSNHSRVLSSGTTRESLSNDFSDVFKGIENNAEPVSKLVSFLNNEMSHRISFESVCKPYMTPQTLRSAQLIFSEMMKKLVPVLKDETMNDAVVLVPLISKPILMVRNIILETFIPEDYWNIFVQNVNAFSQVLIDILSLKINCQSISNKLPEFTTQLQNIFSTLKTIGY